MYTDAYYALQKILHDRNLTKKLERLEKIIKETSYLKKRYIDTELMQIHCVAVCYKIENEKYIRNVKLNTTIEEFKKNIKEEYTVKITKDEKNVTTGIIGTGSKVTVSKNGENIGEYIVVVTGDLTGDGKLQNGDLIKLVRYRVELITLEEPYKLAADVNGDSRVTDSDIIVIARVLVNLREL